MLGRLKKALKNLVSEISNKAVVEKEEVIEKEVPKIEEKKEVKKVDQKSEKLTKITEEKKEKVKKGFFAKVKETLVYKELDLKKLEPILEEYVLLLTEADVAYEVAEELIEKFKERLKGKKIRRGEDEKKIIEDALREAIYDLINIPGPDLVEEAKKAKAEGRILKIMFMGVNGVGKTTTIAKVAYMLKKAGITPVLAAADTFRAGAVEQLKQHAERIGVPIVTKPYGSDPAAVAYDAIEFAKARGFSVVLVDTAGRMHVDVDLMNELRKVARVIEPDYKILVLDALTGNDAVEQARFFDEAVGVDGVILTKVDADAKGGAVLSVAATIKKPILYLGIGQGYEDLIRFDPSWFVERLLGE
ncbi:signal recognition particle [Ignicoccus pacificus DSM 13166]|uniref:Signal recognition particle receptor FtsY n=1 Tax=Ignicoccus pacificus DSM 13166 TaxID=940294 RepID=A0A977K9J0_9CREN|nr:signal recognition particle [Ignicoccus pacificus DSM 13166]